MNLQKYLFYFGYNGTQFRGIQRNIKLGEKDNSVAYFLEDAIKSLPSVNTPLICTSSRTDAGVHALSSAFHCELYLKPNTVRYRHHHRQRTLEESITTKLNYYFRKNLLDIRIHETLKVPSGFHARFSATRRTYIYRLAHYHGKEVPVPSTTLPIFELNRCQLVSGRFDVGAVEKACKIIKSGQNFRCFTKIPRQKRGLINTERQLDECKIIPGQSFVNSILDERYNYLDFWDVIVSSQSFLYNQVRRIVALLVGVGQGEVDHHFVEECFSDPDKKFDVRTKLADACGLYLGNVYYPPEAFLEETYENLKPVGGEPIAEVLTDEQTH